MDQPWADTAVWHVGSTDAHLCRLQPFLKITRLLGTCMQGFIGVLIRFGAAYFCPVVPVPRGGLDTLSVLAQEAHWRGQRQHGRHVCCAAFCFLVLTQLPSGGW